MRLIENLPPDHTYKNLKAGLLDGDRKKMIWKPVFQGWEGLGCISYFFTIDG